MVIGLAAFPDDIYFCEGADEMFSKKLGCDLKLEEGSLVLVWQKPADTGAAEVAEIPIVQYEVELAFNPNFLQPLTFNFTESQLGNLYTTQNVARVVIPDLAVGTQHNARVRARTFLGAGPFTSKPTMKVVTSEPSPPILRFVGSGGGSVPFLRVFLDPPEDFGDGNFTGGSRNTSVVLISYQLIISPAQNFGTSYNASVRVNNLVNQKLFSTTLSLPTAALC